MNNRSFLTALAASSVCIMLLFESRELSEGIRRGLFLCSYSVIPSVFPFMALSVFICKSSAADFFANLFRPLTFLLKIPKDCGGVLLSALIGGYPAAAKNINDLVLEGSLDRKSAGKMLCYCVNAGPPFLISAVGAGIFGSIKTGFYIFLAQLLSSVIIAVFVSAFSEKRSFSAANRTFYGKSGPACFVESVVSAAESCFRMCAFIILACGISEIFYGNAFFSAISEKPAAKAVFTGLFEVTAGCFSCAEVEGIFSVVLAGAIASFSGISVILQVAAVTDESRIPLFPFIISRFFHAGITAVILRSILAFSGGAVETFSSESAAKAALSASVPAVVSLFCMASLFLLSIVPPKSEKEQLLKRFRQKFFQR